MKPLPPFAPQFTSGPEDETPLDAPAPAAAGGWADRAARLTTILMVGRLIADGADHICRVRNVSSGGMMIECDAAIAVGATVKVELRNLNSVEAKVVWSRPPRLGVQFASARDVAEILHAPPEREQQQPRAPRLSAACRVLLWHVGRTTAPTLLDLSQSGCRLMADTPPPAGASVRVTVPGLEPRHATVRWVRNGEAGLAFREAMSFAELSGWQTDHQARFVDRARAAG